MNQHSPPPKILIRAAGPGANGAVAVTVNATVNTWNPATGTVEVVVSTAAPILTPLESGDTWVSLPPANATLPAMVPLLDNHNNTSVGSRLGIVTNLRVEGDKVVGLLTFSPSHPLAQLIMAELDKHLPWAVSVGYTFEAAVPSSTPSPDGRPSLVATKWTVHEVSLVNTPADQGAGTRSLETSTSWGTRAVQIIRQRANAFGLTETDMLEVMASTDNLQAATDEFQRRVVARQGKPHFTAIGENVMFGRNTATLDNPEVFVQAAGEALAARHNPRHKLSPEARQLRGKSVVELARESLTRAGQRMTFLHTPGAIIERAMNSTSDFPALLAAAGDRILRTAYNAPASGLRRLAAETSARDFREKSRIQIGEAPALEKVIEGGEFRYGSLKDAKANYRLETFGKIVGLSRQAMVNDDLGGFDDLLKKLGQAAAAFEADEMVRLLTQSNGAGPVFDDGARLFHATHKNLAAAGGDIAEASLSAARKAMRLQTGLGSAQISVTPKYLLVGPERETEAEKIVSAIQATTVADVNVFSRLEVVVEPRLSGHAWYIAADPQEIDGLEYCYLEGEPGPQLFTDEAFETDGTRFKVRLDFGCGFVDWRGWYMNPGE